MKYRNFIVNTYEEDPSRYLSKIACRRILHGDAASILRIYSFLQKEGIINRGQINSKGSLFYKKSTSKIPDRLTFKKVPAGLLKTL